jgi:hypothetical protein
LLLGVFWLIAAAVVLKFNHASVVTVGVLTGIMFLVFAVEEFILAALDHGATRLLWVFLRGSAHGGWNRFTDPPA